MKIISKVSQSGFTIIELLVSMTIFATTLLLMLSLFSYTLKLNRRTDAIRQLNNATALLSEQLTKDIRNGKVMYPTSDEMNGKCPFASSGSLVYGTSGGGPDWRLYLRDADGDLVCYYWGSDSPTPGSVALSVNDTNAKSVYLYKNGVTDPTKLNPANITIESFRVWVRPYSDPNPASGFRPNIQPSVSFAWVAKVTLPTGESAQSYYQTTVSNEDYSVPGLQ